MAIIGTNKYTWDQSGEVKWKFDGYKESDLINSGHAVALTDHMLSTLKSRNSISFCEIILRGLVKNEITVKPIGSELKSATLEFHTDNGIYTIFAAKNKLFCNNQKLEQALSQMSQNCIGKLLATTSQKYNEAIKFGILGVVTAYEKHLRVMHDTYASPMDTYRKIRIESNIFINGYPYKIRPGKIEKLLDNTEDLIEKIRALPSKPKRSLLYLQ
jgi:hypothetical protein